MTENWKHQQPYAYWLECVRGLGRRTRWELTERAGSPKAVYDTPEEEWREILPEKKRKALGQARAGMDPEEIYLQFCRHPVRYLPNTHPGYPARLRKIPDPPFGIFLWGELPPPARHCRRPDSRRWRSSGRGSVRSTAGIWRSVPPRNLRRRESASSAAWRGELTEYPSVRRCRPGERVLPCWAAGRTFVIRRKIKACMKR